MRKFLNGGIGMVGNFRTSVLFVLLKIGNLAKQQKLLQTQSGRKQLLILGMVAFLTAFSPYGSESFAASIDYTLSNMHGIKSGKFPEQYSLRNFEHLTGQKLTFKENPNIYRLNDKIPGNPKTIPGVKNRLPDDPLVVVPYYEIGKYGGVLRGLSNATEAGTSDLLSIRHVNLVRYDDNLRTIVPYVAKGWKWNKNYTELTFYLRKGQKWSDGKSFTAHDIAFWYNDLILNKAIYKKALSIWLAGGKPLKVTAVNNTTIEFSFPQPSPNFLSFLATTYAQPFQPKHFLSRFLPKYNPEANEEAKKLGYKNWVDRLLKYYRASDWKDVPTPLLNGAANVIVPTLEAYVVVKDTQKGRHLVANPFFFCVDTAGNQLPYISKIKETYVPEKEVRNLMIISGQVDYKSQALFLDSYPLYKENEKRGDYIVDLVPTVGTTIFYSFNTTDKNPGMRKIFNNLRFRKAMSLAINRKEIKEMVYLGQGDPVQSVGVDPDTVDFVPEWALNYYAQYNPEKAKRLLKEIGLKDINGDGYRQMPDGKKLTVRITYSSQGAPVELQQLIKSYWDAVGIRTVLKEVTSAEYRELADSNNLDLTVWKNDGVEGPQIGNNPASLIPPFGTYFNPGTGFMWAVWLQTKGKKGIKPPEDVFKLIKLVKRFVRYPLGSKESNTIGAKIVTIYTKNLWKIGIVRRVPSPVIHSKRLGNFKKFTDISFGYYWAYPYRPIQWFFKKQR